MSEKIYTYRDTEEGIDQLIEEVKQICIEYNMIDDFKSIPDDCIRYFAYVLSNITAEDGVEVTYIVSCIKDKLLNFLFELREHDTRCNKCKYRKNGKNCIYCYNARFMDALELSDLFYKLQKKSGIINIYGYYDNTLKTEKHCLFSLKETEGFKLLYTFNAIPEKYFNYSNQYTQEERMAALACENAYMLLTKKDLPNDYFIDFNDEC